MQSQITLQYTKNITRKLLHERYTGENYSMSHLQKDLNTAQWEAVSHVKGPVLVVAGAGSGKTRTIVYRLAHLLESGVSPHSILLMTFTRKAAHVMLRRAADLLGGDVHGVTGGTFHAFAFSLLRRFTGQTENTAKVSIMDQGDAEGIISDLRTELELGKKDRSFPRKNTIMGIISKSRNKESSITDILTEEAYHLLRYEEDIIKIAKNYALLKRKRGLYDYDDLLFELETLLQNHAPAMEYVRNRYIHIMVDEFQDTNLVQARLVKLLTGEAGNIMAVGDDAQSIYAFRGANVHNILSFQEMFPTARLIRLEQNYRSTQPVLDLSNALLEQAKLRIKKNLFTEQGEGPLPRLVRTLSDRSQAEAVLTRIVELIKKYPAQEIAVLFRSGYQSYPLEVALNKFGIKFKKFGGIRFTEAAHIRDVLSYLRIVQNPADLPAWKRVMELVPGIGPKTSLKIYDFVVGGKHRELEKFCKKKPAVKEVLHFLTTLGEEEQTPNQALAQVLVFYQPFLESKFADDYPRRQAGLDQLERLATAYKTLDEFLADICLDIPEEEDTDEAAITLSTVHSAKGLEWMAVLIIDLVEERFPSRHAMQHTEDLEEELRLLYVACTRAKKYLELFVPATLYNQYTHMQEPTLISPFLAGLPASVMEQWQESYTGGLGRVKKAKPILPGTTSQNDCESPVRCTEKKPAELGYCHHKIFGRGKIIADLGNGRVRVNFPGFGLKAMVRDYLTME